MPDKDEQKVLKKLAKSRTKAAKKAPDASSQSVPDVQSDGRATPAERSAAVAEKQLSLHRWKVIFAAASALIALVSLIVLLLNS